MINTVEIATCYVAKAKNAKSRNIEFNMSFDSFANIKKQTVCAYSGIPFDDTENLFSFERIDNNIGYVDGNVIPVTRRLNNKRNSHTIESIEKLIEKLDNKKFNLAVDIKLSENLLLEINRLIEIEKSLPEYEICSSEKYVISNKNYNKWVNKSNEFSNNKNKLDRALIEKKRLETCLKKMTKPCKIKYANGMLENLLENIKKRTKRNKKLENDLKAFYNGCCGKRMTNTLVKRKSNLDKLISKHKETTNEIKRMKKSLNSDVNDMKIILNGLKKFENLSKMDKLKIEMGLPLNYPTFKVLKHKVGYNLIGGM